MLPWVLCAFYDVIHSQETFARLQRHLTHLYWQVFLWLLLSAITYHVLAGLRHIACDLGWLTSSKVHGFRQALVVLVLAVGLSLCYGVRLWWV